MDPNETLAIIFQHLTDGNVEDAENHFGYLRDWLNGGGFRPDKADTLALINQTLLEWLDKEYPVQEGA